MSQSKAPTPVIALGKHRDVTRGAGKGLLPNFACAAIMTTGNKDVLLALLETLNPPARAIVIGGGFGEDEVPAVREIASEWDNDKVEVVAMPKGTFDKEGPSGILNYQRRELVLLRLRRAVILEATNAKPR